MSDASLPELFAHEEALRAQLSAALRQAALTAAAAEKAAQASTAAAEAHFTAKQQLEAALDAPVMPDPDPSAPPPAEAAPVPA